MSRTKKSHRAYPTSDLPAVAPIDGAAAAAMIEKARFHTETAQRQKKTLELVKDNRIEHIKRIFERKSRLVEIKTKEAVFCYHSSGPL